MAAMKAQEDIGESTRDCVVTKGFAAWDDCSGLFIGGGQSTVEGGMDKIGAVLMLAEWLTEARVAILVSFVAAAAAIWSAAYTRGQYHLKKQSMKRKDVVLELSVKERDALPDGWSVVMLTARNLEPVSATITAILPASRKVALAELRSAMQVAAYADYTSPMKRAHAPSGLAGRQRFNVNIDPACRLVWKAELAPRGSADGADSAVTDILGQNVATASDLRLDWHWSDGRKS